MIKIQVLFSRVRKASFSSVLTCFEGFFEVKFVVMSMPFHAYF